MRHDTKLYRLAGGTNWARTHSNIVKWADAVSTFASISATDYELYAKRRATLIEDDEVRAVVDRYGNNLGLLLEWMDEALARLDKDERTPEICVLGLPNLNVHRDLWQKHVCAERQSMTALVSMVKDLSSRGASQTEALKEEASDDFSSYSDYSETDTESDEEDEPLEDDDEDDEDDGSNSRRDRKYYDRNYDEERRDNGHHRDAPRREDRERRRRD